MQGQKDPRLKLRELEATREQAIKQISTSFGTVRKELEKMVSDLDSEIAELKAQLESLS